VDTSSGEINYTGEPATHNSSENWLTECRSRPHNSRKLKPSRLLRFDQVVKDRLGAYFSVPHYKHTFTAWIGL